MSFVNGLTRLPKGSLECSQKAYSTSYSTEKYTAVPPPPVSSVHPFRRLEVRITNERKRTLPFCASVPDSIRFSLYLCIIVRWWIVAETTTGLVNWGLKLIQHNTGAKKPAQVAGFRFFCNREGLLSFPYMYFERSSDTKIVFYLSSLATPAFPQLQSTVFSIHLLHHFCLHRMNC